ncbi:hypothetical protein [Colwellia sp. RSH04]|uniref:hypothetical protein n=1 Tax=Colwellia sp. RSH04 TaxID=2305464 RepID=UPI000E589B6E|nr:hypothetical protein [Colwellia sp. RSH04]RHW76731.1 hypothetical protein D1094_06520 [Colwellia sp. RSH04]
MLKVRKNSWSGILSEIFTRLGNALKSIMFIAYFIVGVLFIGGIGIWLPPLIENTSAVWFESQSMFTFSVAILGTLFVEGFLGRGNKQNFAALGLIVGFIAFLLCSVGYFYTQSGISLAVNWGAGLSLLIFLMANVNDPRFDDEEDEPTADSTGFPKADANKITDKKDD